MDRRKRVILIIVAVLVAIGIAALLLRSDRAGIVPRSQPAGVLPAAPGGALARSVSPAAPPVEPVLPPPPASPAVAVRQLAVTFAERYGSFSSEGNYVNLTDLSPVMTEQYRRQTERDIIRRRAAPSPAEFSSVTTVALHAEVEIPNGEASTAATARVTTQRTAVSGSQAPRTYRQALTVHLRKVSGDWRVDGAEWEPQS